MTLPDFILANLEPILVEWETFARSVWPHGPRAEPGELRDHAGEILRATVTDMQSNQTPAQQSQKSKGVVPPGGEHSGVTQASTSHGTDRAESGLDMWAVVAEYRALRASVLRLWRDSTSTADLRDLDDMTRFNESLDQSLTDALHSYAVKVEQDREALVASELRQARKLEALGSFAGAIAHDFNNLLAAVMACSQLLLDDMPEESPWLLEVKSIERAAQHGATLTRQLLAFSRQQPIEPTPINLGELIGGVEDLVRRLIGPHISVRVTVEAGVPSVRADRGQLEQIVLNLASNARDAMPHGGSLTLEVFKATVPPEESRRLSDAHTGTFGVLAVRDTGSGIDDATLGRMFEPFFTTKERGRGTGLGLSTVYGIVAQAGGHIRVERPPGQGTSFLVYLPAVQEPLRSPHGEP